MKNCIPCYVLLLGCLGYFCLGFLFGLNKVQYWRIKWIELEHDFARAVGRKPRSIKDIEKVNR